MADFWHFQGEILENLIHFLWLNQQSFTFNTIFFRVERLKSVISQVLILFDWTSSGVQFTKKLIKYVKLKFWITLSNTPELFINTSSPPNFSITWSRSLFILSCEVISSWWYLIFVTFNSLLSSPQTLAPAFSSLAIWIKTTIIIITMNLGYSPKFLVGVCDLNLETCTLFHTKTCAFPYQYFRPEQHIDTLFQKSNKNEDTAIKCECS